MTAGFERIHPFRDGNRERYRKALERSDTGDDGALVISPGDTRLDDDAVRELREIDGRRA